MMRLRVAATAIVLSGALVAGVPAASASSTGSATTATAVRYGHESAPSAWSSAAEAGAGEARVAAAGTVGKNLGENHGKKDRKKDRKKKKKKGMGFASVLVIGVLIGIALLVAVVILLKRRSGSGGAR
ncbi:hypothetical protein ACFU5O_18170 [Streptomyces sp. NPDC057445]|uniref:hypothetical protein n=1 Tax=Streptomyces sp. NPDC057445 TaxID=3346136 RepID=UPI0036B4D9E3